MDLEQKNALVSAILNITPEEFVIVVENLGQRPALHPVMSSPSFETKVRHVVDVSISQDWVEQLYLSMKGKRPKDLAKFDELRAGAAAKRTVHDPFDEVVLDANSPFVNRQDLRIQLRKLFQAYEETLLLVRGEERTGTSFSFELINHVAARRNVAVVRILLSDSPDPEELAEHILMRLGLEAKLPRRWFAQKTRWALKLADTVARAIRGVPSAPLRVLVFDELNEALPAATWSFLARLAQYAHEERSALRLRIVFVRFREEKLRSEVARIALFEHAKGFTEDDMVNAVLQVSKARGWNLTDTVVKELVRAHADQYVARHGGRAPSLEARFIFLRRLFAELDAKAGAP